MAGLMWRDLVILQEKGEKKEIAEQIVHHVQDLATLSSEGLSTEDKEKFVSRSQTLLQELSQFIV